MSVRREPDQGPVLVAPVYLAGLDPSARPIDELLAEAHGWVRAREQGYAYTRYAFSPDLTCRYGYTIDEDEYNDCPVAHTFQSVARPMAPRPDWQLECTEATPHEIVEALAQAHADATPPPVHYGASPFDIAAAPLLKAGWVEAHLPARTDPPQGLARRLDAPDGHASFKELTTPPHRSDDPMMSRWQLSGGSAWNNEWSLDGTRDVPTALLLAATRTISDPAPVLRPSRARHYPGVTATKPEPTPNASAAQPSRPATSPGGRLPRPRRT